MLVIEHIYSGEIPDLWTILLGNSLNFITLAYVLASLQLIRLSKKEIPGQYRRNLMILGTVLSLLIILPLALITIRINGSTLELIFVFLLSFGLHSIGYSFLAREFGKRSEQATPHSASRYHTSPIGVEDINQYKAQHLSHLNAQKPWKNPKYSVEQLANELQIPKHHLSQVLSEGLKINFFELVNSYRIKEVIKRLEEGEFDKFSLKGLGADCGFNSASTFHRAFKKHTGTTPSAYLKTLGKEEQE